MSLAEILTNELLYGKNPVKTIVKCLKRHNNWPDGGCLEVGKIYDAYYCKDKYSQYVVIDRCAYYYDGKKPDFITEDFSQLEKLMHIGERNEK